MDAVLLGWLQTAFLLACAVFLIPFGRLADIYGRKRIYTYGMTIFTAASVMAGAAASPSMLLTARVFQGLGSAMVVANTVAILTSIFPPEERGKVIGINVAAVYLGLFLGPLLGGLLTHHISWRAIFFFTAPLGLAGIILILWKLKGEWADAHTEHYDIRGALIYAASISALIFGITVLPGLKSLLILATGIAGLVFFLRWETLVDSPLLEVGILRSNRLFLLSNIAALLSYTTTFAVPFLLSLYLQHIKGLDPTGAGLVLIAQPAVMALISPFAGKLSDRVEPRLVASLGLALIGSGLFLFSSLSHGTRIPFVVSTLVLVGAGIGLFSSPNLNAIIGSVEKKFYGVAAASAGTMRLLGQSLSMGIATLLFSLLLGRVQVGPEHHPAFMASLEIGFSLFACICIAGVIASALRGRIMAN